jgi:hypothetical protein
MGAERAMYKDQHKVEAWTLKEVDQGTLGRTMFAATLRQIDGVLDVLDSMRPLNTSNEFWIRHELPWNPEPLRDKINAAWNDLIENFRPDAVLASALANLRANPTSVTARQAFDLARYNTLDFTLPMNWTGEVLVMPMVDLIDSKDNEVPNEYRLYAGRCGTQPDECDAVFLTATRTPEEATALVDRLELIDANGQADENERALRVAHLREKRLRRDPRSTVAEIVVAEAVVKLEARKLKGAEK